MRRRAATSRSTVVVVLWVPATTTPLAIVTVTVGSPITPSLNVSVPLSSNSRPATLNATAWTSPV